MSNFFLERISELYKQCGIDIGNLEYSRNPIVQSINALKSMQRSPQEVEAEVFHFHGKLIFDLFQIRSHNQNDFKEYVSKIWQPRIGIEFYGEKFEIHTYAQLIKLKYPFNKTKPGKGPDFRVTFNKESICIECGTAQFEDETLSDFTRKIVSVIDKKNSKSYAAKDVVLFINISKVSFRYLTEHNRLIDEVLNPILEEKVNSLPYGGIYFHYPVFFPHTNEEKGCFIYKKTIGIAPSLDSFMSHFTRKVDYAMDEFLLLKIP